MQALPLLRKEQVLGAGSICFNVDSTLGPVPIQFRICFSVVETNRQIKIRADWGAGSIEVPLANSCYQILSLGVVDVEMCLSDFEVNNGLPISFEVRLEACF
jgi:hypothetical protein